MIIDKIHALGFETIGEVLDCQQIEERLRDYEAAIGEELPSDYRGFINYAGAPLSMKNIVCFHPKQASPWDDESGVQEVSVFYGFGQGLDALERAYAVFGGGMPLSMIPIANAPFGNQICLGISGDERGRVYFWDKDDEREITGDRVNDFGNLYLIANSFSEFVESLFVAEDEPIDPAEYEDDGESWILEDY